MPLRCSSLRRIGAIGGEVRRNDEVSAPAVSAQE